MADFFFDPLFNPMIGEFIVDVATVPGRGALRLVGVRAPGLLAQVGTTALVYGAIGGTIYVVYRARKHRGK